jgi:hypothetical protein
MKRQFQSIPAPAIHQLLWISAKSTPDPHCAAFLSARTNRIQFAWQLKVFGQKVTITFQP